MTSTRFIHIGSILEISSQKPGEYHVQDAPRNNPKLALELTDTQVAINTVEPAEGEAVGSIASVFGWFDVETHEYNLDMTLSKIHLGRYVGDIDESPLSFNLDIGVLRGKATVYVENSSLFLLLEVGEYFGENMYEAKFTLRTW
ncbi:hypothetical protein AWENTII_009521 [Aspergillus wentii]|nr:hypothetical protein MW887_001226 [Aspergillus wentii]